MGSLGRLFFALLFASFLLSVTSDHHQDSLFSDLTTFLSGGVNGWDFMGPWSKYDLRALLEAQAGARAGVPLVPDSEDQGVFICQASPFPSFLEKEFSALHKGTFQFTYYIMSPNKDLTMTGEVVGAGTTSETLFNYSFPDDLLEHDGAWVTQTFDLPKIVEQDKFKVRLVLRSETSAVWAASALTVSGFQSPPTEAPVPPAPSPTTTTEAYSSDMTVNATTEEPPTNVTTEVTPMVNGTTEEPLFVNGTTEEPPSVNGTTEEPPSVNGTTEEPPYVNGTTEEPLFVNGTTEDPLLANGTTEEPPVVDGTTVEPSTPGDNTVTDGLTDTDEPQVEVGKLANVAQAIWDAFYVFLALFCACLVALVALIVHGRCKSEEEPPPAVATYNPRNASYRLDKVYDNPAYDDNAA